MEVAMSVVLNEFWWRILSATQKLAVLQKINHSIRGFPCIWAACQFVMNNRNLLIDQMLICNDASDVQLRPCELLGVISCCKSGCKRKDLLCLLRI